MMGMISPHGERTTKRRDKKGRKTAIAGRKKKATAKGGGPKLNSVNQGTGRRGRRRWQNSEYHLLPEYQLRGAPKSRFRAAPTVFAGR